MTSKAIVVPTTWRQRKTGRVYSIMGTAIEELTGKLLIHYQEYDVPSVPVWARPAAEFFDGRFLPSYFNTEN
jgi:hypothetical protein